MRCSLCQTWNPIGARACLDCAARMEEPAHRELLGVRYLLGELDAWGKRGRLPESALEDLREDYELRRRSICDALRPPPAPPPPRPEVPPEPPPPPKRIPALRLPLPDPPRPKPPFAWKNLCTEKNIRWILNLGIFIFSVALAVFIHTQWKSMAPLLKVGILFGATFSAMAAGHVLRTTILKSTGMALIVLGSLALPIDGAALVRFHLVPDSAGELVGLCTSLFCLGVYAALGLLYSERLFASLAVLASFSAGGFGLRLAGLTWPELIPALAPWAAFLGMVGRPCVRRLAKSLLIGTLVGSLLLLLSGWLSLTPHVMLLELALASGVAVAAWEGWVRGRRGMDGAIAVLTGLMFAAFMESLSLPFREWALPLSLLGAAYGLGWVRHSVPLRTAGALAGILSVISAGTDFTNLCLVLSVPAAVHGVLGWTRRQSAHLLPAGLLAGLALAAGLQAADVPRLWQPLAFALFGAAMPLLGRRREGTSFSILAVLGAGAAMLFLASWYMQYYKQFPEYRLVGAAIAAVSALAFGPVANRIRSRFVSDITYGCFGFAYLLSLAALGMPGRWLGLSLAALPVAYVLLEKRISRWLLRPTLFTGIACTVGAAVFAFLQWFVWREHLQSSLTLFLVGAFYLAVAQRTAHRWMSHVGLYVAAAAILVAFEGLHVLPEARAALMFLPAGATLVLAGKRRDLHLGLAALAVALGALSFVYLDGAMYAKPRLPLTMGVSLLASALAGWFAFSRPDLPQVDRRLMSGLMGVFASAAYLLGLVYFSTGSPWGGAWIFGMSAALCGAAELLRRIGRRSQAWPLGVVSLGTTLLAVLQAHGTGMGPGVHLWVYGSALGLYTLLGRRFSAPAFSWAGALAGAAGLFCWLLHFRDPWIGIWTIPLAALALQKRERPLMALGFLAAVVCTFHAATRLHELPAAGLVFVLLAALMAFTRLGLVSYFAMTLAGIISWGHEPWNSVVLFAGFALYLVKALLEREPATLYVALLLALLGDYTIALQFSAGGLAALPLAFVLFAMAWEIEKRFGEEFGLPLLGASFVAAILGTILSLGGATDRIVAFAADAALFLLAALLFRRPVLMYACSAALVAFDMALLVRFQVRPAAIAFQLLALSLAKVIFVRSLGERMKAYLEPVFVGALVLAGGVLSFGVFHHETFTARSGEIDLAIWGLILSALITGAAGRIRGWPAFLYVAAVNLLGAYYLTLHKYEFGTLELWTVPIGVGAVIWSLLALREPRLRGLVEGLAVGALFLPSAVQSFLPARNVHTLAALGLAFLVVLLGMAMRRRVFLFGGTGVFIAEVLGKALQFLVERDLSAAEWGMIVGGLMILIAAGFESRKATIVRERFERVRAGARQYLAGWD